MIEKITQENFELGHNVHKNVQKNYPLINTQYKTAILKFLSCNRHITLFK